jgi:hypothetical protein
MSQYYNSKRTRNLYDPAINAAKGGGKPAGEPFRLSRSKIELYMNCPRCFYMDRRLGVAQPPGFPFSLNSAVDALLKNEFDHYREIGTPHPLMVKYGIEAVPFKHPRMNEWRDAMRAGVTYLHPTTNFFVTGAVDDIWESTSSEAPNPSGRELYVVDYKATAKAEEINELDKDWQISYKRQAEIYQWLLRRNNFKVSDLAYFVYANGILDKPEFADRLEFDTRIVKYHGDDSWVEGVLMDIKKCLDSDVAPESGEDCDYCKYREAANEVLGE